MVIGLFLGPQVDYRAGARIFRYETKSFPGPERYQLQHTPEELTTGHRLFAQQSKTIRV